jgi:hypothetical protein
MVTQKLRQWQAKQAFPSHTMCSCITKTRKMLLFQTMWLMCAWILPSKRLCIWKLSLVGRSRVFRGSASNWISGVLLLHVIDNCERSLISDWDPRRRLWTMYKSCVVGSSGGASIYWSSIIFTLRIIGNSSYPFHSSQDRQLCFRGLQGAEVYNSTRNVGNYWSWHVL